MMISLLSKNIARFFYENDIIRKEKIEICEYGFELIISTFIGFIITLTIGLMFRELMASLLYYCLFVGIRLFTGGYHAKTHLTCKLILTSGCLFVLFGLKIVITANNPKLIYLFCILLYLISVFLFTPIEHINAPMSNESKLRNRKISIITALIIAVLNIITIDSFRKIAIVISLTLFVIAVLIIIPKIFKRR